MFLSLLPEIQEHICSYCTLDDLKNLTHTNSEYERNKAINDALFHTVRIPHTHLEKIGFLNERRLNKRVKEKLTETKVLLISASFISQRTFEAISNLDNLLELDLYGSVGMDDSNIRVLCKGLKRLKMLRIGELWGGADVSDKALFHMQKLVTLEELVLQFYCSPVTDKGISYLSSLTGLKKLRVGGCSGIANVSITLDNSVLLEEICLRNCGVTDVGVSHISNMLLLKKLDLSHCNNITDEGISYVRNLVALEELYLRYCAITDVGVSHLSTMTKLRKLDLSDCRHVTDMGMFYVRTLVSLQELYLIHCNGITDLGVSHISTLTMLKKLDLNLCRHITEEGISFATNLIT